MQKQSPHTNPTFVGEMPKILVNGSSNYSIIESIEAEHQQQHQPHQIPPQTPIILIHAKGEPIFTPENCECIETRRLSSASELRKAQRRERRRSSSGAGGSVRKHSKSSKSVPFIEISPDALEKERRHRFVVSIVMGTFFFIVIASVLVVVITLTSQTHIIQNENGVLYGRYQHHNVYGSTPATISGDNGACLKIRGICLL